MIKTKKTTAYRRLVCSFSLTSITDVMSISKKQERFFSLCFLTAAKSALTRLTANLSILNVNEQANTTGS